MKKAALLIIILLMASCFTFADDFLRVPYPMTMRQQGMGDAFTAVADDYYLLFTNPAGLGQKKNLEVEEDGGIVQIPPLNIQAGIQLDTVENILKLQNLAGEIGQSGENQIASALDALGSLNRSNMGVMLEEIVLPFGYVGNRFGFNAFPVSVNINMSPVISLQPGIYIDVAAYTQFIIGFAPINFNLGGENNFHIGFAIKAMGLGLMETFIGMGEAVAWMENPMNALDFVTREISAGPGFGLNVGALWNLNNGLSFGVSVLDAPSVFFLMDIPSATVSISTSNMTFAYPNLRAGISYQLNLQRMFPGFPKWLLDNIIFALDMNNIIDPQYPLWTKPHAGVSFNLFCTRHFGWNFSGGINKGYLTFSTTVKLLIFRMSYAFYQDEGGIDVGDFPVGHHAISFNLRW